MVLNQPPSASSQNSSSCGAAARRAHSSHAGSPIGLEQLEQARRSGTRSLRRSRRSRRRRRGSGAAACRAGRPTVRSRMNDAASRAPGTASRARPPSAEPRSTRAARANAAIIRPFHAVSTLSSRCGRGRCSARRTSRWRARPSDVDDLIVGVRPVRAAISSIDSRDVEQVLAGELLPADRSARCRPARCRSAA